MKIKETINGIPKGYIVNKDLSKYSSTVLFPEKLKKITELIENVPPPTSRHKK